MTAPTHPALRDLVIAGAIAGSAAAACTTVIAALARAVDASLEVGGSAIPVGAFAWWTIVGAALGIALARLLRERRRFAVVAISATLVSLAPALAAPDDDATRAVLVVAHVAAASIIIPALGRRLVDHPSAD